jgi:hypothetical protein
VNDPKVGLAATVDADFFKMFAEDTGLFVTLCFYDKQFSENIIYSELVSGRLSANLGYVYENAVAQALTAIGFKLYYHTFKKDGDTRHSYEIDFVTTVGDRVRPIESKSSRATEHRSLDEFISKKGLMLDTPIVMSPKNLSYADGILYLPAYMMQFLDGKEYGSDEADDSYTVEFEADDWIPVDGGYIIYIKGREHGKTEPIVSVTAHRRDGSSESVDAAVETDTRRNVKITYDERMHCTVRISEINGEA